MLRLFRHYIPRSVILLGLVEIVFLYCAIALAYYLRLVAGLGFDLPDWQQAISQFSLFVGVLFLCMTAMGLYLRETCRDLRRTFVGLLVAFLVGALVQALIFFLFPDLLIWRSIFVLAYLFSFFGLLTIRWIFGSIIDLRTFQRRFLVLGAGPAASRLADVQSSGNHSFAIARFVRLEDEPPSALECSTSLQQLSGRLRDYCFRESLDGIITCSPSGSGLPYEELLQCKLSGIVVINYPDFLERETGRIDLEGASPGWMIYSDLARYGNVDQAAKRAVDLVSASLLLLVSLPLQVLTALAIKLDSRGPIFYLQERVGQFGKSYKLIKFRSMVADAEKDGPQWASEGDQRITRVGQLIRKLRIDELPQLINVFTGDMSLVGPRPERPFFVEKLREELPFFDERHAVKPGITGWAQVNYPYGASLEDARRKVQYDLYYVKNGSIFLDILILIQTVRVVLFSAGAR